MISLYHKILNGGVTAETPIRQVRSIKLTNLLTLIFIFSLLIHIIIYFIFKAFILDKYLLVFLGINAIIISLNFNQHYNSAKLLLVISCNFIIYLFGMTLGKEAYFSYYFLIFLSTAFLLFPNKDIKSRIGLTISLILPVIGFLSLEWNNAIPEFYLEPNQLIILRWSNIFTLVLCNISQLTYWFYLEQKSEHDLEISHAQLQTAFDHMTEGVLLQNQEGIIIQTNPSALRILGMEESQVVGNVSFTSNLRLLKENGSEIMMHERPSKIARATGKAVSGTLFGLQLKNPEDGEEIFRWISIAAAPIFDGENPTPYQVIMTITDMTEIKETEMKLHHSAKLSSLGEMAAGIAHEINNPLSVIVGKSYVLKTQLSSNRLETNTAIEHLNIIEKTALRIASIIQGLRAFAREEIQHQTQATLMKNIISDTLLLCSLRFTHHQIDLRVGDFSEDLFIECRPTQISQVILNLLNNSYDAIADLPDKWISLEVSADQKMVFIRITDSGPGISKTLQQKIFLPFFTTKDINKGTGMGLSISAGIIKSHQGILELDGSSEHTSFLISLPKEQSTNC